MNLLKGAGWHITFGRLLARKQVRSSEFNACHASICHEGQLTLTEPIGEARPDYVEWGRVAAKRSAKLEPSKKPYWHEREVSSTTGLIGQIIEKTLHPCEKTSRFRAVIF